MDYIANFWCTECVLHMFVSAWFMSFLLLIPIVELSSITLDL